MYNNAGSLAGSSTLIFDGTNVGIGSPTPGEKLDVTGNVKVSGAIIASAGATSSYGIKFADNPGGGVGDTAWIRYRAITGERTVLEIGVANDGWTEAGGLSNADTINIVTPAGIGINQQDPGATLDVNGTIWTRGEALFGQNIAETVVIKSAIGGDILYNISSGSINYYNSAATSNWTVNFRFYDYTPVPPDSDYGSCAWSFPQNMTITAVILATQGSTPYYPTAVKIDGTPVTVLWQGGIAPAAGNANSVDAYVYTIIRTGVSTYTVMASQTKFSS
jgi:hypothetical protein